MTIIIIILLIFIIIVLLFFAFGHLISETIKSNSTTRFKTNYENLKSVQVEYPKLQQITRNRMTDDEYIYKKYKFQLKNNLVSFMQTFDYMINNLKLSIFQQTDKTDLQSNQTIKLEIEEFITKTLIIDIDIDTCESVLNLINKIEAYTSFTEINLYHLYFYLTNYTMINHSLCLCMSKIRDLLQTIVQLLLIRLVDAIVENNLNDKLWIYRISMFVIIIQNWTSLMLNKKTECALEYFILLIERIHEICSSFNVTKDITLVEIAFATNLKIDLDFIYSYIKDFSLDFKKSQLMISERDPDLTYTDNLSIEKSNKQSRDQVYKSKVSDANDNNLLTFSSILNFSNSKINGKLANASCILSRDYSFYILINSYDNPLCQVFSSSINNKITSISINKQILNEASTSSITGRKYTNYFVITHNFENLNSEYIYADNKMYTTLKFKNVENISNIKLLDFNLDHRYNFNLESSPILHFIRNDEINQISNAILYNNQNQNLIDKYKQLLNIKNISTIINNKQLTYKLLQNQVNYIFIDKRYISINIDTNGFTCQINNNGIEIVKDNNEKIENFTLSYRFNLFNF